jgi:hypothetical protein
LLTLCTMYNCPFGFRMLDFYYASIQPGKLINRN